MPKTLVQLRGVKVAKAVLAQAERWAARDLRKGHIGRDEYEARLRAIEAERTACGL